MLQLASLKVQNFRALKDGFIDFEQSTIIIGENGAGISTLLEAISLTLDHSLSDALPEFNKYHFHVSNNNSQKDKKLTITLRFKLSEELWKNKIEGIQLFPDAVKDEAPASKLYDIRFNSTLTDSGSKTRWSCTNISNGARSENSELLRRIRELMPVVRLKPGALAGHESILISENSTAEKSDDKFTQLKNLINKYASEIILGHTLNLDACVENGFQAVKALIQELRKDEPESISFKSEALTLRQLLQIVSAPDTNASNPLDTFTEFPHKLGALLLLNALLVHSPADQDTNATPLLIFEFPENQLHNRTLATVGTLTSRIKWQKIVTTNSGWLLGSVPFNNIRRIRRKEDMVLCSRINSSNYSTEDLRRIAYHLRIQNNTASYSRFWILVEGETEYWILPHLARIMGYNFMQEGISVIDFAQTGLKPIIKFAMDLDIGWHVLLDGDAAGQRYQNTIESINENQNVLQKITKLEEDDIEQFFWNNGYAYVYANRAKLSKIPIDKLKPTETINRSIRKNSKPYMALKIIEEISAKGKDSIPKRLCDMIESCIGEAKNY